MQYTIRANDAFVLIEDFNARLGNNIPCIKMRYKEAFLKGSQYSLINFHLYTEFLINSIYFSHKKTQLNMRGNIYTIENRGTLHTASYSNDKFDVSQIMVNLYQTTSHLINTFIRTRKYRFQY